MELPKNVTIPAGYAPLPSCSNPKLAIFQLPMCAVHVLLHGHSQEAGLSLNGKDSAQTNTDDDTSLKRTSRIDPKKTKVVVRTASLPNPNEAPPQPE